MCVNDFKNCEQYISEVAIMDGVLTPENEVDSDRLIKEAMDILNHLTINAKVFLSNVVEETPFGHLPSDDVYIPARRQFEGEVVDFMKINQVHFKDFEVANLILTTNARVIDFASGTITHKEASRMLLELDGTKEVLQTTKDKYLSDWQAFRGPWINEPHMTLVTAVNIKEDKLICQ